MHMHVLGGKLETQEIMPLWSALSIYISWTFSRDFENLCESCNPRWKSGISWIPGKVSVMLVVLISPWDREVPPSCQEKQDPLGFTRLVRWTHFPHRRSQRGIPEPLALTLLQRESSSLCWAQALSGAAQLSASSSFPQDVQPQDFWALSEPRQAAKNSEWSMCASAVGSIYSPSWNRDLQPAELLWECPVALSVKIQP